MSNTAEAYLLGHEKVPLEYSILVPKRDSDPAIILRELINRDPIWQGLYELRKVTGNPK